MRKRPVLAGLATLAMLFGGVIAAGPAASAFARWNRMPSQPWKTMDGTFVTITCAIAESFGIMVGCTRCSIPFSVRTATPSSFTR